jgi:hypothetical protein
MRVKTTPIPMEEAMSQQKREGSFGYTLRIAVLAVGVVVLTASGAAFARGGGGEGGGNGGGGGGDGQGSNALLVVTHPENRRHPPRHPRHPRRQTIGTPICGANSDIFCWW